jgi:hypothetical protein
MYLDYEKYARANGHMSTGIHTRIDQDKRISSIYRIYSNPHFEQWAWETFLWDGDKIIKEYDTFVNVAAVVDLHCQIVNEINNESKE